MGFLNVGALVDAELNGQSTYSTFRKSPSQATSIGVWFDLSMSPGNPSPQYYAAAPLIAQTLAASTDGGLFHGGVIPGTGMKHLKRLTVLTGVATALPMPMMLCDYLLFYPFFDEGVTGPQSMLNTQTLTRYADGAGVQIMAVSVAGRTGGASFQVTYTNQAGVPGRLTAVCLQNSVSLNGNVVTSDRAVAGATGPFLPLQAGDSGVRSIQSVAMVSGSDVGLTTFVLVKPLAQLQIRGIDAPVEVNYLTDFGQLPEIKADAYLNFLCCPAGALNATPIHGDITTVWST